MNNNASRYGALFDEQKVILDSALQAIQPTIITWLRLEPLPYTANLEQNLEAQVADPLWMLTRQWQFSEFQAEDAGSPISVKLEGEQGNLSRYCPGAVATANSSSAVDYQHLNIPLEVAVEQEAIRQNHPRLAAEAGEHLLRLLNAQKITNGRSMLLAINNGLDYGLEIPDTAFLAKNARHIDPKGESWQTLFAKRALDGRRLAEALRKKTVNGALQNLPDNWTFTDVAAAKLACETWLHWYDAQVSEPTPTLTSAWVQSRQEYAMTLSAQMNKDNNTTSSITLAAEEYTGGHLDWYSFDAVSQPSLGNATSAIPSKTVPFRPLLPTPARYPGMPVDRYWEFEDARVNLGSLEAGPTDLTRLLLAEYALVFGTDWFMIPIELPIGSLFRIKKLTVQDTFGVVSSVDPARTRDGQPWRMFSFSEQPDLFFLAPSLPAHLEGEPLEEVALFRDEMANMAWAVEHIVQGASGEPRDRRMEPPAPAVHQRIPYGDINAEVIYRLATPVADQWLPFIPVPTNPPSGAVQLARRVMQKVLSNNTLMAIQPKGVLMRSNPNIPVDQEGPLYLNEEEVPRAGAIVRRNFEICRWLDGQRFLWCGRSKQVGKGEGASGLRYDIAPYKKDTAGEI